MAALIVSHEALIVSPEALINPEIVVSQKGLNALFRGYTQQLRAVLINTGSEISDAVFTFLSFKYINPAHVTIKTVVKNEPLMLGSGKSGTIYAGTFYNGDDVAIKKLVFSHRTDEDASVQMIVELSVMAALNSPYIVSFHGFYRENNEISLIMEHMTGGDLFKFFDDSYSVKPDVNTVYTILLHVARGIHYLHSQTPPIVHRDLKLENILLDASGNAKLTDFGASTFYLDDYRITTNIQTVGTRPYTCPYDKQMTPALDIYAFGVVCLMMLSTLIIQDDDDATIIITMFEAYNIPGLFAFLYTKLPYADNVHLKSLMLHIHNCLNPEALKRPSASKMVDAAVKLTESTRYATH
jgi:serine/threonine protein kinase